MSTNRWAYGLSLAAFLVAVFARVATFADYGISWDETFRVQGGAAKAAYLEQIVTGERRIGDLTPELAEDTYPGFFDVTSWWVGRILDLDPFVALHVWVQTWSLSALGAVWLIGWRLGGPWTGLGCLLFLSTAPRFWGHAGFNPKDVPFLTGYAWSLWWLLEAARFLPRLVPWRWIVAGAAAGLCAGTRLAGLVFVLYASLVLGTNLLWSHWRGRERQLGASLGLAVCFSVVAVAMLWPFFPPIHLGLTELWGKVSGPPWEGRVLFEGAQQQASSLPPSYLPKWLFLALPEGLLVALGVGLGAAWKWIRRPRRCLEAAIERVAPIAFLAFTVTLPVFYTMLMSRSQYDGLRHSLFLHVPLSCLAALGVTAAIRQTRRPLVKKGLLAAFGLSFGWNVYHLVSLHPYQYVYFNATVGHLAGADGRYEKDYWGLSLKEAIESLEKELADVENPPPIASMRPEFLTQYYLRDSRLRYAPAGSRAQDAGYLIVLDRWNQPAEAAFFGGPAPKLAVTRQGVELCRVLTRESQ